VYQSTTKAVTNMLLWMELVELVSFAEKETQKCLVIVVTKRECVGASASSLVEIVRTRQSGQSRHNRQILCQERTRKDFRGRTEMQLQPSSGDGFKWSKTCEPLSDEQDLK